MAKGFYISKVVGIVCVVVAVGAVATIIALSVVYSQEKAKNNDNNLQATTPPSVTKPPSSTTAPSNQPWDKYRLRTNLVPWHYNVTLWPRLTPDATGKYIFTGESSVEFAVTENSNLILLHSHKLNYGTLGDGHSARLTTVRAGNTAPGIVTMWLEPETQYLVAQLDGYLQRFDFYIFSISFDGELADDLGGFYRSEYTENGVKKVIATTQMQPTHARKAFPCFDEPILKATFDITLIHDLGTVALSNGKEIETTNVTMDGENVRIFARKPAITTGQGDYALNKTGPILKFFESYYNYSYLLPKSDQIALPDFNAGAMENWGLITYRETALLYDEEYSSNFDKERTATIIAHELAHMWFGNLATMRWWNDLWLNEGFASYMQYLGADQAEPTWNIKDLIVLNDVHRVFAVDALASSHPLSYKEEDIQTPAQINELFDAITYCKGASVLRMLSDFLTEHVFIRGIQVKTPVFTVKIFDCCSLGVQHIKPLTYIIHCSLDEIIQTVQALKTTTYLSKERAYMPWASAINNLDYFYLMFDRSEVYGPMQDYLRKQVTPLFNYYENLTGNWSDVPTGHMDQYNQVNAISLACRTNLKECQELTMTWFRDWMNTGVNKIHPNLRFTVYCNAIAAGGADEWEFAWDQFQNASIATEAEKLRIALSCTKQAWLLNRYLEYTLNPDMIRKQDATSTIVYIANNVVGQSLAWDFVRARWEYIFNQYGGGSFSFSNLISGVTERFSTEFELQELKQFKADNAEVGFGSGTLALDQSIDRTTGNIKWVTENKNNVLNWFIAESMP
uniref:Aminopeptidase n=1 Tax=Acanthochromis polyacanthus TaxID=80966 RepID=A0A3Q1FCE9_9TELE